MFIKKIILTLFLMTQLNYATAFNPEEIAAFKGDCKDLNENQVSYLYFKKEYDTIRDDYNKLFLNNEILISFLRKNINSEESISLAVISEIAEDLEAELGINTSRTITDAGFSTASIGAVFVVSLYLAKMIKDDPAFKTLSRKGIAIKWWSKGTGKGLVLLITLALGSTVIQGLDAIEGVSEGKKLKVAIESINSYEARIKESFPKIRRSRDEFGARVDIAKRVLIDYGVKVHQENDKYYCDL